MMFEDDDDAFAYRPAQARAQISLLAASESGRSCASVLFGRLFVSGRRNNVHHRCKGDVPPRSEMKPPSGLSTRIISPA